MKKIVNMTPHPINILDAENKEVATIEPCGQLIRLAAKTEKAGDHNGIPLTKTVFGEPEGLPEPIKGTLLIVSQIIKSALPGRTDLVVPAEVIRDGKGRITGCRSLGI